jgi:hypothetical protein
MEDHHERHSRKYRLASDECQVTLSEEFIQQAVEAGAFPAADRSARYPGFSLT